MIYPKELSERGLTLVEITVVGVVASIVMLGMVGFYISSQGTWMDASAQAITQREATTLIEDIAARVHAAASAQTNPITHQLELYDHTTTLMHVYWWEAAGDTSDSLVHDGPSRLVDDGAPVTSVCQRFDVIAGPEIVDVDLILRSAEGDSVRITTKIAMMNRDSP